ncbi:hypothetical protein FXN63_05065 [Pigmentiphaga aceris]|uniref:Uncharacterized protein n=1 Tax=Pigmentiphaga aceris TaxID=1940612 RepID=A0A5C0ASR6_9BURK|nr:hypothetical protein [Pigmentiphaga aceris]QEI05278.1 hypothetical protein FXN63_05065 [Pigmentiphaga aceris]
MNAAACPWRLSLVGAHVQPMKWMLAVQSVRQVPAARTASSARATQSLQVARLTRPADGVQAMQ